MPSRTKRPTRKRPVARGTAPAKRSTRKRSARKTAAGTKRVVRRPRRAWVRYADEKLLDVRLCDLDLKIEGTWLERPLAHMEDELARRDIRLRPHYWLSEEFFCPEGVPGVAIPFYLAHPRLIRLERKQMLEAEGSNHDWCMKILRHEVGHAIQHAYNLHRLKKWRQNFGNSAQEYPEGYRPNPGSKSHVINLYLWYAQSHPDEDFAETFAVWLKPKHVWRKRFKGWPALKKLEYVDELMGAIGDTKPKVMNRRRPENLPSLRKTLRQYYLEKKDRFGEMYPDIYDRDLTELFSYEDRDRRNEAAASFLRRNRREIRGMVARWTGEYQYTLDQVLGDMIGRCRELSLHVAGSERQLKLDFAILLTVRTVQSIYTRREWHPL